MTTANLSPSMRAWLLEPQMTSDGAPIPMTLGWHLSESSTRYYFKEGGGGGFHSTDVAVSDARAGLCDDLTRSGMLRGQVE